MNDKLFKQAFMAGPQAWINNNYGTFTYREDYNLYIQLDSFDNHTDFNEDWAKRFPDPEAKGIRYAIMYQDRLINNGVLVAVDGYRLILPIPALRGDQLYFIDEDISLAKIINTDIEKIDEYLMKPHVHIITEEQLSDI